MRNSQFRQQYREKHIPDWYSGWFHLLMTTAVALGIIIYSIYRIENVQALEWLALPVFFLLVNFVEYMGHRYPMHHPMGFLKTLYVRHSKQHHIFFTHEHMEFESSKDFKAVLFPIVLMSFFFGLVGTPIWFLISLLFSNNIAWMFALVALAYFLNYEYLHFAYHVKKDSWVNKIPGLLKLRQLHLHHHNPKLMATKNFNITYPICDILFKTYYKPK
jgi:hypothetical protein